ncbi:uncharacterized protein LOC6540685 [Drosophila erecta]|uniref:Uncharacterized protein n=1 Tax=Drosophila erecta TaxID=7220 RepID=B3N7F8_DROER|nr:uncharacterized protein LOC6540685 [Drosophila erecta]EDV59363.1 uncharacterized protein Dere_GG10549 [Drosophila erecta]
MGSKRKHRFPLEEDDQQENSPDEDGPRVKQHFTSKDLNIPRDNERIILAESTSTHQKNTLSRFQTMWQTLNKSGMSSSQPDSPGNSSFSSCSQHLNTSWPGMRRRAKALPLAVQNFPRTPPSVSYKGREATSLFQTSWKSLMTQTASCNGLSEDCSIDSDPPTPQQLTKSSFQSSWKSLSQSSLNKSNCPGVTEDSYIESSPAIQLVPYESPRQYLSISRNRVNLMSKQRFVRGGYAEEFRKVLKKVRMDQRQLENHAPTHTVRILSVSNQYGVTMALVAPENGSSFNILPPKGETTLLTVGSKVQFYIDPKIKPLELKNNLLVHFRPYNIVLKA